MTEKIICVVPATSIVSNINVMLRGLLFPSHAIVKTDYTNEKNAGYMLTDIMNFTSIQVLRLLP